MKLGELISHSEWQDILNSVMPGHQGWRNYVDNMGGDCKEYCPYYSRCDGQGPKKRLCTKEWQDCEVNKINLQVMNHILHNFVFYNQDDLDVTEYLLLEVNKLREFINEILDYRGGDTNSAIKSQAKALQNIRLTQYNYKQRLMDYWGGCSITGVKNPTFLVASHIKPWALCENDEERNDKYNGLLLLPHFDFAFDKGYITFDDNGKIILSRYISDSEKNALNLSDNLSLRMIEDSHKSYLKYHRNSIFIDNQM